MAKNEQTRLTETIAFIGRAPAGSYTGDRTHIVAELTRWRQANPASANLLSQKMSLGGVALREHAKSMRAYRRSLILLKCAIGSPQSESWDGIATQQKTMIETGLPVTFGLCLEEARDVVHTAGSHISPMINLLKSNPLRFLQNNIMTVMGKKTSIVCPYDFYMRDGTYKVDPFIILSNRQKIIALNVPATLFSAVENSLDAIPGTSSAVVAEDTAVMLTTQFTGCTFCFSINNNSIVAAHIDPGGGTGRTSLHDGESISAALRGAGCGFSNGNGGTFKAYGRNNGPGIGYPTNADQMTIVAVRSTANVWDVYSQILIGGQISSAQKIS